MVKFRQNEATNGVWNGNAFCCGTDAKDQPGFDRRRALRAHYDGDRVGVLVGPQSFGLEGKKQILRPGIRPNVRPG